MVTKNISKLLKEYRNKNSILRPRETGTRETIEAFVDEWKPWSLTPSSLCGWYHEIMLGPITLILTYAVERPDETAVARAGVATAIVVGSYLYGCLIQGLDYTSFSDEWGQWAREQGIRTDDKT